MDLPWPLHHIARASSSRCCVLEPCAGLPRQGGMSLGGTALVCYATRKEAKAAFLYFEHWNIGVLRNDTLPPYVKPHWLDIPAGPEPPSPCWWAPLSSLVPATNLQKVAFATTPGIDLDLDGHDTGLGRSSAP